ncbi:MAG TPA: 2-oxo acid dehydrogenase subunit E2 [Anaerolineae bacterium]|nr:2-oxo acid dehydrogenase subunit E2 [Anaerolineae bacterium]
MAIALTMPKLGLTMTEGKVVKWLKEQGEQVQQAQPVVVVMSKKITYEIEAPASGTLHVVALPKEDRKVTEVIGYILGPGEEVPAMEVSAEPLPAMPHTPQATAPIRAAKEPAREGHSSPAARRLAKELGVDIHHVPGSGRDGRIREEDVQRFFDASSAAPVQEQALPLVTPLARRMAEEEGLSLAQIPGTGPDGRITEDDVLRALEGWTTARPRAMPLTGMRQAIAEGMMASLHSTAQLTLTAKADVTALVALRDVLRRRWDVPVSYTDLIVKAVASALREHPLVNSTLLDNEIVFHDEVAIGVAVALDQGLIVPVVHRADEKSVPEIHCELDDLAERARAGALSVDEVTGGTFTITNLGMYGVETFTPIINPPEVGILGVGCIGEELALQNGLIASRSRMTLSLTIDHRVVDGAPGAAFLQAVVQLLEQPALILAGRGS